MSFVQGAADRPVEFIRQLKHTKTRWAGVPFNLLPWQELEVVRPLFGTLRQDGSRQYRTAYIEVPRKNGKSELAAALALYLLVADSEPGGEVYLSAADRDQASLVFAACAYMVRTSVLSKWLKVVDSTKRIIVTKGVCAGSFLRAIPADAAGSHGFNASAVIMDEVHVQPNRDLWDVLSTSMGARSQPLMIGITTAGYDRNSLCWELHEYARQIKEGVIDDPSFLPVIYGAGADDDWQSEATWAKANPSLNVIVPVDFYRAEHKKAEEMPAYENTFRRLYLDQWTSQSARWLPMQAWDESAGPPMPEEAFAGKPCYAGLDLSQTRDLTAFEMVFPPESEGEPYRVLSRMWIPEENVASSSRRDRAPYDQWVKDGLLLTTPGNTIDYESIQRQIRADSIRFGLIEVAFDPTYAWQMAQNLQSMGLTMISFRQGFQTMAPATADLLALVRKRQLQHGGHAILRWMADNVVVEQDASGAWKPSKRKSTQRIDGIVALIMGLDRALRHENSRPQFLGIA